MKKIIPCLSKIATFYKSFIELCTWLLFFAIGIRFFETILLSKINHDFFSSMMWNLTGLCFDIFLFLRISIWIILPFLAICLLHEKMAKVAFRIFLSLMLLLSLICVLFFITSGFLLDKVVFTYSLKDNLHIIQTSSKSPVWVYAVVIGLPALFYYLSGKLIKINKLILISFTVLFLLSFFVFRELPFSTNQYHVKTNKTHFFLKSTFSMFNKDDADINDENYVKIVKEFRSYFPKHQFAEKEFPFLHQAVNKDVLSPFFNLKSEPPNLVFIMVEGLGYEFLKSDLQLMPFLDSLSKKSLTWEHCFSASARTFGVLPALFGATPLGNEGFLYQCPNNPEHNTLLKILNQNNYVNHFFYGGSINFDNMKFFCTQNNMTYFTKDDWDEDVKNERLRWIFEDHLLYLQALRKLNKENVTQRVDVYLSLNSHNPFKYPNSENFQNIVRNKVTQSKSLSVTEKKDILNAIHIYGSYPYADWALQQLFEGYKKRADFENTIFIITGDHHVTAKQFGGYYNYHVPLFIYSPMLKTSRTMKGVVSHRDITPSVLSLLKNNYNIETPKEVTWLNTALDTSITFNANTFSPLQLIDHSIGGVLYKNYLLCESVLEEFTDGVLRKVNNPNVQQKMKRLLSLFCYLDCWVFNNNALIKNDLAYNNIGKELISIEDEIAPDSHFAKISNLPVKEGPDGHKSTLFFNSDDLYPIDFLIFDIPEEIEEISVDIEFQIYIKNEGLENFYVVMDLWEIYYRNDDVDYDRQNKWYFYKRTIKYKKELWQQAEKKPLLKVYLWNPNKLEGYVDDIKVKVKSF